MAVVHAGSYDVHVPNKTIYVSDGDLPLYQRAQELAGGNLSAAIAAALRRYVDVEEGRREGFDEIIVRVGPGKGRKVRFVGVLLGEWLDHDVQSRRDIPRLPWPDGQVRPPRRAERRNPRWSTPKASRPAGAATSASATSATGSTPGESTLDVIESLDELRERIPPQLFDMVAGSAQRPPVEDLDI